MKKKIKVVLSFFFVVGVVALILLLNKVKPTWCDKLVGLR